MIRSLTSRLVARTGGLALLLLLSAGTWQWTEAWVCLAAQFSYGFALITWMRRHDISSPGGKSDLDAGRHETGILLGSIPFYGVLLFAAGLDTVRFQLTSIAETVRGIGFGVFVVSLMMLYRAATNSPFHEIKAGTTEDGPYHVVRHPVYAAGILSFLSFPIALGSIIALIPAAALAIFLCLRIPSEEKQLRDQFPWYGEYLRRVHFRLVPGLFAL